MRRLRELIPPVYGGCPWLSIGVACWLTTLPLWGAGCVGLFPDEDLDPVSIHDEQGESSTTAAAAAVEMDGLVVHPEEDPLVGLDSYDAETLLEMGADAFRHQAFDRSAQLYAKLVREFPDAKVTPLARYNAGLSYERLEDWSAAACSNGVRTASISANGRSTTARRRSNTTPRKRVIWSPDMKTAWN